MFIFIKNFFSQCSHKTLFTFSQNLRNLYDILELSPKASFSEIKSAYYGLAQKYHPDKNPSSNAAQKFSEIKNAYEILSDDKKRNIYDSYNNSSAFSSSNSSNSSSSASSSSSSYNSSFSSNYSSFGNDMFEDFDKFFYSKTSTNTKASPFRGKDLNFNLSLSFLEAANGCKKKIKIKKKCTCKECSGNGCKKGTNPMKCYACGGKGTVNYRDGFDLIEGECDQCEGRGKTIKYKCSECKGRGQKEITTEEEIAVPEGVAEGQILRREGAGDAGDNGGRSGDLLIKVDVDRDFYYQRDGSDIITNHYLSISQAVLGAKVKVRTLVGEIEIKVEKGTQHGDKIKLANMGIKKVNNSKHRGNHFVIFNLVIPKNLNEEQSKLFQELADYEL